MRMTVTADDAGGPLLIALECAPLGAADVAELTDRMLTAARVWWHDPPTAEAPGVPEAPEVSERPDPSEDEVRRAAYVMFDRGRSVHQTAAALNLPRELVREWNRRGRW